MTRARHDRAAVGDGHLDFERSRTFSAVSGDSRRRGETAAATVMPRSLQILQIGSIDEGGGAASVATALLREYRARGCRVWHVVGRKRGDDNDVIVLPDDRRGAYRWSGYAALQGRLRRLAGHYPNRGWGLISRTLRSVTHPRVVARRWQGLEDFDFPGSHAVLNLLDGRPDIVHCHNLHGEYFDLRALATLSNHAPCVLTLHDMWLLTGHCAYSLGCNRWQAGCGQCPDLNLYPSIRRDATAANWRRKRDIYAQSRLYVATPSRWLLEQVQQSMLAPALMEARVIPNGIDLSLFRPGDKNAARVALGIPIDAAVVLMSAGSHGSMWKDDKTLVPALKRVAAAMPAKRLVVVALGRDPTIERRTSATWLSPPYQTDAAVMASYYQAADVYAHAARADNFPSAVLESLACGTPVVATDVGGIAEQVKAADIRALRSGAPHAVGEATGALVPVADVGAMADAVFALLSNESPRITLGANGRRDMHARFDLQRQADVYLAWYRAIINQHRATVA